jgi:phosphoserine phosphatase RsbU/P
VQGVGPASLVIALGDVMGHGIAAALMMATARGVLRAHARHQGSLGHLLNLLNEHIVTDTRGERFMTMLLAVIDVPTLTLRWASAGHDQPLIYDPQRGLLTLLNEDGGGLPLGVSAEETYQEMRFTTLRAGQVVLIGTDGLWEAQNVEGEQFGKERVGQALRALSEKDAAAIEAGIYEKLRTYCGGHNTKDDITYVVIKVLGDMPIAQHERQIEAVSANSAGVRGDGAR